MHSDAAEVVAGLILGTGGQADEDQADRPDGGGDATDSDDSDGLGDDDAEPGAPASDCPATGPRTPRPSTSVTARS
ncbi:hypothetical protein UK99_21875 [Frankia casuarinae]|nr:hypothetical protein KBI5_01325 [Frankia sp. KB5]ORT92492.1 hypothetical protein UK99_21875 [Frankia casuarinae]